MIANPYKSYIFSILFIFEEIQSFFDDLKNEKEKSKVSLLKNKSFANSKVNDKQKEKLQGKVLKWFSKLNLEERIRICTISNKYLTPIISKLYEFYKKDNNIFFEPTEKLHILFKDDTSKIEKVDETKKDEKCKISSYSLNLLKSNGFSSIDENFSGNKKEYGEKNEIYLDEDEKTNLYKKYFIIRKDMNEDKNKINKRNIYENDFLKYLYIISSNDQNIITLSDELLSDFEQFKNFFLFFSDNNCFKEWLLPNEKSGIKYFTLPYWLNRNKVYFTLFQIIIAFFEQRILMFYEYYYYTNKIYDPNNDSNKIKDFYNDINTIVGQLNNDINCFDNIFNENVIQNLCNKNNINSNHGLNIFNGLKNFLKDFNSGKEKIIKLLKMITLLIITDKIVFYEKYKIFIFDFLRDEIAKELINEDKKSQVIKKNKNKKNKKSKNKKGKFDCDKNNKEEEKIENNEEKNKRDDNAKTEINKGNENAENEGNIIAIKQNINNEEKKNKKNKEFFLYTNNIKKNKKESNDKKNKISNKSSSTTNNSQNIQENNNIGNINNTNNNENIMNNNNITIKNENNENEKIINNESETKYNDNNKNNNDSNKNDDDKNIQNQNNKNNDKISINQENNNSQGNCNKTENTESKNFQNNNGEQTHKENNYNNKTSNNYYNNNNNETQINNNNFDIQNLIFDNKLKDYYDEGINNYISITNRNLEILNPIKNECVEYIKTIIKENLGKKYLLQFGEYGSYKTGLSIEGSDIDICIIYKNLYGDSNFFNDLEYILVNNSNKPTKYPYTTIKIDARIKRIVVTLDISEKIKKTPLNNYYNYLDYDDMNKIKIDFTLNENEEYLRKNMENVYKIKNQLIVYPQIRDSMLVLKRYLKVQNNNEFYLGGIGSYELFLMVLNVIKSYLIFHPNIKLRTCEVLIMTFEKFSFYNFAIFGIGPYNNDFNLRLYNRDELPYIIDPLTGNNVAQNGPGRGDDIRKTFGKGYKQLCLDNNNFKNDFNKKIDPFKQDSTKSLVNLFNAKMEIDINDKSILMYKYYSSNINIDIVKRNNY